MLLAYTSSMVKRNTTKVPKLHQMQWVLFMTIFISYLKSAEHHHRLSPLHYSAILRYIPWDNWLGKSCSHE